MDEIQQEILQDKYLKAAERTADDVRARVAKALAAVETDPAAWEPRFLAALQAGFIPAGRINSAAGTDIQATLINCFVQPVGDSMSEPEGGKPGITQALAEAAETMRRGGGVGYDFSRIRPQGARVKGTSSLASGPISYMRMFDAMCQTVESAGSRRGAQMGVLRCDHPDIFEFVRAKAKPFGQKELTQFNISVGVVDAFMQAVEADGDWDLVHAAEPSDGLKQQGAHQRWDGRWVYRTIRARELWDEIMRSTYDFADPGVLFLDAVNRDNNLAYCESIEATNPCGEQPLPDYGCCCLGSMNLASFVRDPFTAHASFDADAFRQQVPVAVRMLDNVLDLTYWPLPQQRAEAQSKRRIGLGVTGLGSMLLMLGLRYDSDAARARAAEVMQLLRDHAYLASIELAGEKGSFAAFDAERYLQSGFSQRLPPEIREAIAARGLRNSHLLSIAPTGTISIAFGGNCSSGVEPVFAWHYRRMVRQPDGGRRGFTVYDGTYAAFKRHAGLTEMDDGEVLRHLPGNWVTAHQIAALDHMRMVAAVAPWVDSAVSKTINVAESYPYEDFQDIYLNAWRLGLKGITTYRPNSQVDAVLQAASDETPPLDQLDPDRRIHLEKMPRPVLSSLRWAKRPRFPAGNDAWCYMVDCPCGSFAIFVGHADNGHREPFEVWVNGAEQPRALGALAKSLSMDMRSKDRGWLERKLDSLIKAKGDDGFTLAMPPKGEPVVVPSVVSAFARIVKWRCEQLGAFEHKSDTPVLDALLSPKEPKTGPAGTLSWSVDVLNPSTGDDFVLLLKELTLPDGQRRPYSLWLSGEYPRVLDGLCKSLSYDMRVIDPAWIGGKLRQLLDYAEPRGDFFAKEPGSSRSHSYPSTVAYIARLIIHRHAQLGILDEGGYPLARMGLVYADEPQLKLFEGGMQPNPGRKCEECGAMAVIRKDGCDFCTACGAIGACG